MQDIRIVKLSEQNFILQEKPRVKQEEEQQTVPDQPNQDMELYRQVNQVCMGFIVFLLLVIGTEPTYVNSGLYLQMISSVAMIPGNIHFIYGTKEKKRLYKTDITFLVYLPIFLAGISQILFVLAYSGDGAILILFIAGAVNGYLFYAQIMAEFPDEPANPDIIDDIDFSKKVKQEQQQEEGISQEELETYMRQIFSDAILWQNLNILSLGISLFIYLGLFYLYGIYVILIPFYLFGGSLYPYYHMLNSFHVTFQEYEYQKEYANHVVSFFYVPAANSLLLHIFNILPVVILGSQTGAIPALQLAYSLPHFFSIFIFVGYGISLNYHFYDGKGLTEY